MRRLPGRGNAIVRAGLRHAVGFFAYFEHRRRAPNLAAAAAVRPPPPPLFFGRRRRYPRRRRSRLSTSFVFVQHQPVASVAVIYLDRFIYSDNRG